MGTPAGDNILLTLTFPITGQWGTIDELNFRLDLEHTLDNLLRQHDLGTCSGGLETLGEQDIDLRVPRASWQAAWELVRSKLAELNVLGRATARVHVDDKGSPPELWPLSQASPPVTSRPRPGTLRSSAAPAQRVCVAGALLTSRQLTSSATALVVRGMLGQVRR
jgi:hypothetical protein